MLWQVDNIWGSNLTHSFCSMGSGIQGMFCSLFTIRAHHVAHQDSDIHTMLVICAKPFDNNQCVFNVLFADKTSFSGMIPLSNSGENGKVGINMKSCSIHHWSNTVMRPQSHDKFANLMRWFELINERLRLFLFVESTAGVSATLEW